MCPADLVFLLETVCTCWPCFAMQGNEIIEIHCLTEIVETCFVAMVLQGRHLISLEHSISHQAVIDILKAT